MTRSLDQVEFEAKDPVARFRQEYKAKASNSPLRQPPASRSMAAAPVGMFFGILGLLVLAELHAGRVHDPEELPNRLKLHVLGVVPPLPRPRIASGAGQLSTRDEARSRRDLDQFIQSLDHLRVAICSGRDAWGRARRSIVITSACGSEGKTTLAAQLAERCVNAGLLTLLVNADIRNPTLSRMFDLPTGRGLVNILRGEAMAEEAISVIGGAGGLPLPARRLASGRSQPAAPRRPPLQAPGQRRESFDMVIVDSPPVLPVPDALTIGRSVNGAVLAVRYDTSRFPLVEARQPPPGRRRRPGHRGGDQRSPGVGRGLLRVVLPVVWLDRRRRGRFQVREPEPDRDRCPICSRFHQLSCIDEWWQRSIGVSPVLALSYRLGPDPGEG